MNEIKATYKIYRNDAVLAGKSVFGPQAVTVDPAELTPEQRTELVTCETRDGAYHLDHLMINGSVKSVPRLSEPSQDAVRIYLDARIAVRKEAAAEVARKKAEGIALLSDPDNWILRNAKGTYYWAETLLPDLTARRLRVCREIMKTIPADSSGIKDKLKLVIDKATGGKS